MTVDAARKFIVLTSLIATGLIFVFFVLAKPLEFPLDWDDSQRIIEILLPVFLGYLGTATHFLFHQSSSENILEIGGRRSLLGILVKGPVVVFAIISIAILFAFGYSNRHGAQQDSGMSVDQLSWAFTAALGILAVSTGAAVSYLFSLSKSRKSDALNISAPENEEDAK